MPAAFGTGRAFVLDAPQRTPLRRHPDQLGSLRDRTLSASEQECLGQDLHVLGGIVEDVFDFDPGFFGISPRYEDLDWTGLDFSKAQYDSIIDADPAAWAAELKLHDELFKTLEFHLPAELKATKQKMQAALAL